MLKGCSSFKAPNTEIIADGGAASSNLADVFDKFLGRGLAYL
jgi:hypothetical protein